MSTQYDTELLSFNIKMIFPGLFHYQLYPGKMTHLCQKLCSVVYPAMEESQEPHGAQEKHGDKEDGKSSQTAD